MDFCRERLSSYKIPRSIEFMDEIPKSAFGKILKKELQKKHWQKTELTKDWLGEGQS